MSVFGGLGIEIDAPTDDEFLKIRETLTRVGVVSGNTLTQSCHILHKQGRYAIMHFKEMFILDGKTSTLSEEDRQRRDLIVNLLHSWKLARPLVLPKMPDTRVTVIPFKEKNNWNLVAKYDIGHVKRRVDMTENV